MIIEQAAAIRCGVEDKNVNSVSWQDISFAAALITDDYVFSPVLPRLHRETLKESAEDNTST